MTSTYALTDATMPYLQRLAEQGTKGALAADAGLAAGLNVAAGAVTNEAVARDQGREWVPPREALGLAGAGAAA